MFPVVRGAWLQMVEPRYSKTYPYQDIFPFGDSLIKERITEMSRDKVLVIDDDPQIVEVLDKVLQEGEFDVTTALDGFTGLTAAKKEEYAVAIVDLSLPGLSGIETMHRLKKISPDIEVIIFTGNPSFDSSVEAIHEHVFDYLLKPTRMRVLLRTVQKAVEHRHLKMENRALLQDLEIERNKLNKEVKAAKRAIEHGLRSSPEFVGRSVAAQEIRRQIAGVAPSDVNILLLGESGVGKDVVANLIHKSSGRDPRSFVKINCPAIPESLLESELFGHEAGAFTGATKQKPGRFELASGGTIFLDEIGDLPFSLQSKLLQAVEQKQFYRVGGKKPIHIDVRIIAATNAPLSSMINEGQFRADLFYRLNEYSIEIPPLRERKEDLVLLIYHFLDEYKKQFNAPDRIIPPETLTLMEFHSWPGNVRELQSVIRRFVLMGWPENLLASFQSSPNTNSGDTGQKSVASGPVSQPQPLPNNGGNDMQQVLHALSQSKWNRRKAAKSLGMSYSTLRRRITEYELNKEV